MRPVIKTVLLHDICAVGKAAMTNMMPVLSALGIEACPVPTVLLSTHTGGYGKPAVLSVDPAFIRGCADHFKEQGIRFEGIFAGYAGNAGTLEAMRCFARSFPETPLILDPIMGDHGKYYSNFDESYGEAVRGFLPEADVLLPNLTEACLLTGTPYREDFSERELMDICRALDLPGKENRTVVLTGVTAPKGEKGIALLERKKEETRFAVRCFAGEEGDFHGTGDLFDGVFLAHYLKKEEPWECIRLAHTFVRNCIRTSRKEVYPEREGLLIEKSLEKIE